MYLLKRVGLSLLGALFGGALPALASVAGASPPNDPVVASAQALLSAAGDLPPQERSRVLRPAVATLLLAEFARLLPPSTTEADLIRWADLLLHQQPTTPAPEFAAFPPADEVLFDGTHLFGGGFARPDALVGLSGRPIAMDRQIPINLLPLDEASALRLKQQAALAATNPTERLALQRTEAIFQAPLAPAFVEDGIFLRPYNGRMDDLYYRLAQDGNVPAQMTFHAVAETLPNRRYHPLTGVVAPSQAPPPLVQPKRSFQRWRSPRRGTLQSPPAPGPIRQSLPRPGRPPPSSP